MTYRITNKEGEGTRRCPVYIRKDALSLTNRDYSGFFLDSRYATVKKILTVQNEVRQ